jgi:hypothetical protein
MPKPDIEQPTAPKKTPAKAFITPRDDPPRQLKQKISKEQFESDWLWRALKEIYDHTTHQGYVNNALLRRHVKDCLRLIKTTNTQAIAQAWEQYLAQ